MNDNELQQIELDEKVIESMVYEVRGEKVMLDSDLAMIYGYSTKAFNRQVQRNIDKFDGDFMFKLTKEEANKILESNNKSSRCQNVTMNKRGNKRGLNIKYIPSVFTEQGIYMLMTVLKGELAVKQSKTLIRLFKQMKDYIIENTTFLLPNSSLINAKFESYDVRFKSIENKIDLVMNNFINPSTYKHYLIANGEKIEADLAYQQIYSSAKKTIFIIDDYIDIKTLHLLLAANSKVKITIFSDNVSRNPLKPEYIEDFVKESKIQLTVKPSNKEWHDRYIIIDYMTNDEKIFSCGSSSKDSGNKITTIQILEKNELYHPLINRLIG